MFQKTVFMLVSQKNAQRMEQSVAESLIEVRKLIDEISDLFANWNNLKTQINAVKKVDYFFPNRQTCYTI